MAQRQLNRARVDKLASEMELEQLGNPTVNHRDEWFYIIDGQHRVEGLKKWLGDGGWEDQSMQCWTYEGEQALTEEEEAEVFLKLNDTLTVSTFEKFTKAVRAGRLEESDIDRIVRAQALRISKDKGAIRAVGALRTVYRLGPATLARSLRIIRDAYGEAALEGPVIEGLGLLCQRYNGEMDEAVAVEKLGKMHGGANGLTGAAEQLRHRTGWPRAHCIAATAVDVYNPRSGRQEAAAVGTRRRVMTAKIGGSLPKGDANGMGPIVSELVHHPHRMHVLLCLVDCKKVTTDNDTGEVIPTARIRRVEVVLPQDLKAAEKLLRRALEKRAGLTVLPMDMEDEITIAFGRVDPRTGEVLDDESDGEAP